MEVREEPVGIGPEVGRPPAMPMPGGDGEAQAALETEPQRSIPQLLRQLTDQITTLFTKEMALARSEVRQAVSEAKTGVGSVASGGAVMFGGFLTLLGAAVAALSLIWSVWLSALVVGVVTLIVGYIMLSVGKRKLQASRFKPERTVQQMRRDREMAQYELRHGGAR